MGKSISSYKLSVTMRMKINSLRMHMPSLPLDASCLYLDISFERSFTPAMALSISRELHTSAALAEAALSSARAKAVALAKFPSWRAAAWSPTVGTAALAAATILPEGYREGRGEREVE